MKQAPEKNAAPPAMHETVRQEIIAALSEGSFSARDLSALVSIPEREVAGHLEHIQKTLSQSGRHLVIQPAKCKKCGFVFAKREKFTRPGKCPVCKGESIREPLFSIAERD
jgi:predicted Zn-ribbon and HTH transcriptional regulator